MDIRTFKTEDERLRETIGCHPDRDAESERTGSARMLGIIILAVVGFWTVLGVIGAIAVLGGRHAG